MKEKHRAARLFGDLACLVAGCGCFGVSVALFSAPHGIVPGGVTGLATVVNHLWGIPIGLAALLLNLPLLAAAWRQFGRNATLRALLGILLSSAVIDLARRVLPAFSGERMLAALFGGVLTGAGLGLILSRGYTTGGTEIVARLLERRRPHIPIGRLMLATDAAVIGLAAAVWRRLDTALYAVVLVAVSSALTDRILYGGRKGRVALIFCSRPGKLTAAILRELRRGVTLLQAQGGFSARDNRVVLCAVSPAQLYPLKRLVLETDPDAFFLLLTADEVLGSGWSQLDAGTPPAPKKRKR